MANLIMSIKLIPSAGSGKLNRNRKGGGNQWFAVPVLAAGECEVNRNPLQREWRRSFSSLLLSCLGRRAV
jgi:hypothetical protein